VTGSLGRSTARLLEGRVARDRGSVDESLSDASRAQGRRVYELHRTRVRGQVGRSRTAGTLMRGLTHIVER
jgi:hypothetical protein